jgi:methylmalonyl-CoA/ethylmalonyl-CoA epimerase
MIPFEFHHLGLATKSLERAAKTLQAMGYETGGPVYVPAQDVTVCFASRPGHPTIEIIEPGSEKSPVRNILDKGGSGPYHLCYRVPDLSAACTWLEANRFQAIGPAFISNALDDQRTCFFYHNNLGLVEITEEL